MNSLFTAKTTRERDPLFVIVRRGSYRYFSRAFMDLYSVYWIHIRWFARPLYIQPHHHRNEPFARGRGRKRRSSDELLCKSTTHTQLPEILIQCCPLNHQHEENNGEGMTKRQRKGEGEMEFVNDDDSPTHPPSLPLNRMVESHPRRYPVWSSPLLTSRSSNGWPPPE